MEHLEPKVGIAVVITKVIDGKCHLLAGRRKGSHGAGKLAFPGGHLEFGETWANCVHRELAEECGKDFKVEVLQSSDNNPLQQELFITNDIIEGKHYITIYMLAEYVSGELVNAEPHKCEKWEWLTLDQLDAMSPDKNSCWIPIDRLRDYEFDLTYVEEDWPANELELVDDERDDDVDILDLDSLPELTDEQRDAMNSLPADLVHRLWEEVKAERLEDE